MLLLPASALHVAVLVCRDLPHALDVFEPDMVVYNAGTDVLLGDPLGALDITPEVYFMSRTYS